jgi:uncharacterized protein (TIGR00251 family)
MAVITFCIGVMIASFSRGRPAYAAGMAEIEVRVIPGARRDEIGGERGGRLLIRLTAPPVGGAANAALRRLVGQRAGVPARRVSIRRGQRSRDKVVRVEGLTAAELRAAMSGERE